MKKEGFYFERIRPVVVMIIITVVCIGLVSGIYLSTKKLVTENEDLVFRKAVLYAAGISVPESNVEINSLYDERVTEKDSLYIVKDTAGEVMALAFIVSGPGLWGDIEAVTAFDKTLEKFSGVEFTSQNETPGLGARITESWFKEQLRGKSTPLIMLPEGTRSDNVNEIDAITGATRTSDYVLAILNDAGVRAASLSRDN
ncbi:MAG: FMN-binding protein [Spirochaetales bacterium]|nr:FMN-binding protein [Spirochaetales bacterium]